MKTPEQQLQAAKRWYHANRDDVLLRRALSRGLGGEPYDPERDRRRYERQQLQRLIYGQLQYLLRTT